MALPIALLFATGAGLITQSEVVRNIIESSEVFVGDEATELGEMLIAGVEGMMGGVVFVGDEATELVEMLIAGVEGMMGGVDEIMAGTEWRVVGLSASSNSAVSVASPIPVALVVGIGGSLFGDMRVTAILLAFAACGVVESLPTTTPQFRVRFPGESPDPIAETTTKGGMETPPGLEVPGKWSGGARGVGGEREASF